MMSKEVLTAKYNQEIKLYEMFIEALKKVNAALHEKNCDGKVINARITKAVQNVLERDDVKNVSVYLKPQYKTRYMSISLPNDMRYFRTENGRGGYVDHDSYMLVELDYKNDVSYNERLNLAKTNENFKTEIARYTVKIEELKKWIANYDEYQKANEEFKRLVKEYEDKIPYRMRYSVRLDDKYEVIFIAKPLEEAEVDPIVEFVSNLLTKNSCNIEKVDRWGKRHLAYPVKKQADGYYVLINFEADPATIKEIDRVLKIRDEVLKHLIVKIDE